MKYQQTVEAEVTITGQALHGGFTVTMKIIPQPADTGVLFGRTDLPGIPTVKAETSSIVDTRKSVSIGKDGWHIATIEHLMAAFHGLGIDNALVLVDNEELPAGDFSGQLFTRQILKAGIAIQDKPRNYTYVKEPLWVEGIVNRQNEPARAFLIILPSDNDDFTISYTFSSDHPVTGTQFFQYNHSRETFINEICSARTIAFTKEIEYLRSQGLALGGDINSVVVVGDNGYENELRYPDEIVRHKILDIMGDLYLAGPLVGHVVAVRSGHALDLELAKKITNFYKK